MTTKESAPVAVTAGDREAGAPCQNCLRPVAVGQVVLPWRDAGEMHADCDDPYSINHVQQPGCPEPVVLIGCPMQHVSLAALAQPRAAMGDGVNPPIERMARDLERLATALEDLREQCRRASADFTADCSVPSIKQMLTLDCIQGDATHHLAGIDIVRANTRAALALQSPPAAKVDAGGWCSACGCGNDRAGYAHLPKCRAQYDEDTPCTDCDDTGITKQTERACSCEAGDEYRDQPAAQGDAAGPGA